MKAEDYFQKLNGGKPSSDFVRDGEYVTATWAVLMMESYATEVVAKRLEDLRQPKENSPTEQSNPDK
jgi:hypothetical protein